MDLESTVEHLAPRLLAYCLAMSGNHADAEEVSQDALAALIGRWQRHGEPESPAAFVFAVARRRLFRASMRRRLWAASRDGSYPETADGSAAADTQVELLEALAALQRLGRSERQALLLVVVAGLPISEAASVLGISISAVKMRLQRGRARLANAMLGGDRR